MAETGITASFLGARKPFELREFPVPDPEPGALVIRMRLANVCGSDLHYWRGDTDLEKRGFKLPCTIGHEGTGEVLRIGQGAASDSAGETLREGDRVVFAYFHPCRQCPTCLKGDTNACPRRQIERFRPTDTWPHFRGTFAQFFYLYPKHAVFKVPDNVSDGEVAGVNCAVAQMVSTFDRGRLAAGETVVIQGAGGLGVYAAALAKARGAAQVIAIDGVSERLRLIRQFGADATIDLREFDTPQARVDRVRELTGGVGGDMTLELVGHPGVVDEGLQMTAPGGRYMEVGNINAGWGGMIDPSILVIRSITLFGVVHYRPRDLKRALDFVSANRARLPLDRVVSHRFALTDINEAFEQQNAGHVTRSSLVPGA